MYCCPKHLSDSNRIRGQRVPVQPIYWVTMRTEYESGHFCWRCLYPTHSYSIQSLGQFHRHHLRKHRGRPVSLNEDEETRTFSSLLRLFTISWIEPHTGRELQRENHRQLLLKKTDICVGSSSSSTRIGKCTKLYLCLDGGDGFIKEWKNARSVVAVYNTKAAGFPPLLLLLYILVQPT